MILPGEFGSADVQLEASLEGLFSAVPLNTNDEGTWDGLPDHLIVTMGRDKMNQLEYILAANWHAKDKGVLCRPMLDFNPAEGQWSSGLPHEDSTPLFKVITHDLLNRPYRLVDQTGVEKSCSAYNFEVFPGRVAMWGEVEDGNIVYGEASFSDLEEYWDIGMKIAAVFEFGNLLKVPELTPESFLAD